jgi:hypothetical protein
MTVNFRGYIFDDAGSAVSGASVKLLETGTTTQEGSTVTSDSNGLWNFAEADQDRYDVEITKGSSVRRIRWDDQISLKEIDVRNNTGATTPALTLTNLTDAVANQVAVFSGANATRADGDEIYLSFKLADSAGNIDEFARLTAEATDVTSGSEDGQMRFGVIVAGTLTDVFTINSSTGGAATISYEVDSFTIKGGEGEAGVLYLFADQGDDAGEEWKINVAPTSGAMTFGNDIASEGTFVTHLTITPHATITSSSVTIPGILDVNGSLDIDGNSQLDGTITVGVDDTGYDVKLFGATSGQYLLWDESADELVLAGDTKLSFHDAAGGENIIASANGHLEVNAGTTLDITAPTVDLNSSTEFNIDTAAYDLNASGAVTIDAAGLATITGTNDAVGAIYLRANAGTSETVKIHADQGTSVTEGAESVTILSDAGGVGIRSTANLANAVNVTVDGGTSSTITLFNDQGTAATEGAASIQLLSDAGGINVKSGLNGANAILLTADAGTSETIVIHADQGTGTGSIKLLSDAGGIEVKAGTDIILDAGGADIFLKDGGTLFGTLTNSSGELVIKSSSSGTTAATFSGANVTLAGTVGSGAITSSGIIKTDDTTAATSTTDGSLQTDGGLSVALDAVIGDDLFLLSDSAVFNMGAGSDFTITHDGTTGATIAGNPLILDSGADITLDAEGADIFLKDGGTLFGTLTNSSGELVIKSSSSGTTAATFAGANVTIAGTMGVSSGARDLDKYAVTLPQSATPTLCGIGWLTGGNARGGAIFTDSNDDKLKLCVGTSDAEVLVIDSNGATTIAGSLTENSDARIKSNVATLSGSLALINRMRGVSYDRTDVDDVTNQIGLIAQELELIVPGLVATATASKVVVGSETIADIKSVSYTKLVPLLVEAIKELSSEIDALKA